LKMTLHKFSAAPLFPARTSPDSGSSVWFVEVREHRLRNWNFLFGAKFELPIRREVC
jgi:hypothetical protein